MTLGGKAYVAKGAVVSALLFGASTAGAGIIHQVVDSDGDGIPDAGGLSTSMSSVTFDRESPLGQAVNSARASVDIVDYTGVPEGVLVAPLVYREASSNCAVYVPSSVIPGTPIIVPECPQGTGPVSLEVRQPNHL